MRLGLLIAMFASSTALAAATPPTAPAYRVAEAIPGPDGGWDYARVDPVGRRLYVARTDSVTVIDLAHSASARSIGRLERGHAVVPIANGARLLVTSGNDGTARILDVASGAEISRIVVGKKADGAILDAGGTAAYVMSADGGTVSIVDIATARITKTIVVKPALEYAAFDKHGTLFINDEDANEIETVDVRTGKVGAAIALTGCEAPSGLAYDAPHDRLISACANGKAAVVAAGTGRLVGLIDIGSGPDAVILDAERQLAFIPSGKSGVLDILSLAGDDVVLVGQLQTEVGARTGALDSATGALYLPTAKMAPAATPGGRPTPVPGTFHVLVVRPD